MTTSPTPLSAVADVGRLFGVGVGPGDPDLMTVTARRTVETAPVVAHFAARRRPGNAWTVVAPFVTDSQRVLRLEYPVTTEAVDKADYERLIEEFYDQSASRIAARARRRATTWP